MEKLTKLLKIKCYCYDILFDDMQFKLYLKLLKLKCIYDRSVLTNLKIGYIAVV